LLINCKLIKSSKRRTICISINTDGAVVIRAPKSIKNKHIENFLKEKKEWIKKNIKKVERNRIEAINFAKNLNPQKIKNYKLKAKILLQKRVNYFSHKYKFKYNKIKISNAKTRWGSCSANNNLNFNWKIIFAPKNVIDYLIIHELVHTIHKNHQKNFWNMVEKIQPDYKKNREWLKKHSYLLQV
jgi:hypothetical protein